MLAHGFALASMLLATSIRSPSASAAPSASATIDANEAEAVRALRQIHAAEETFRQAVHVDTNCDGVGEYGYLAELAGTCAMRVASDAPCRPMAGSRADVLDPPLLPQEFGRQGRAYQFIVAHQGYYFRMWIGGQTLSYMVPGFAEDPGGGKRHPPWPDSRTGSRYWVCYAWPIHRGLTGIRAFCINQRGIVLKTGNRGGMYFDGAFSTPPFGEAFENIQDLSSPLRIGLMGGEFNTIWRIAP